MRVKVKLVVFKTTEPDFYYGYCRELRNFFRHEQKERVVYYVKNLLYQELCHRLRYENLELLGWKVSENSAIPPIFTDEEAIERARKVFSYSLKYKEVTTEIIELNVELPEIKNLW